LALLFCLVLAGRRGAGDAFELGNANSRATRDDGALAAEPPIVDPRPVSAAEIFDEEHAVLDPDARVPA